MVQFSLSNLGGGRNGVAPKLIGQGNNGSGMDGGNTRAIERNVLRRAFGNNVRHLNYNGFSGTIDSLTGTFCVNGQCLTNSNMVRTGPFRLATNSGDPMGTTNKAASNLGPKPPNQAYSKTRGWKESAGSIHQVKGDTLSLTNSKPKSIMQGSAYSGNPKFVYDGSDYVRFKKLQAVNRNYNDKSFGGDQHSASQTAIRRTRI